MKRIDIKSMIIGMLTTTCLFLLFAFQSENPYYKAKTMDTYRYQAFLVEHEASNMTRIGIIDTFTGSVTFPIKSYGGIEGTDVRSSLNKLNKY